MRQFGIDYFVSVSPHGRAWAEEDAAMFDVIAEGDAWTLFRVHSAPLVQPLANLPHVTRDWNRAVVEWLTSPSDTMTWKVLAADDDVVFGVRPARADETVQRAELAYNTVRFETDAIGVPHLVRVAYFPNWNAYGADGPYRAAPGFMIVVPQQREIELRFERTWVEQLGRVLTVLGVIALIYIAMRERRRARAAQ
jgi:hypothetical protein